MWLLEIISWVVEISLLDPPCLLLLSSKQFIPLIKVKEERADRSRDVIKDEIGGKLSSGRPRASAFTPRTGFYRPRSLPQRPPGRTSASAQTQKNKNKIKNKKK
jgi:hypothetical protein